MIKEKTMRYTSAEANKLLKGIEARIEDLKNKEKKSRSFHAASTEDPEVLRPAYDFEETQKQIAALEKDVRIVKHAINMFNVTHTVPDFDELTIDQALVYLPQLSNRVSKLKLMAAALPRERAMSYGSNIIDYENANYNIAGAEQMYRSEQERLRNLQTALDRANSGETMEIDIVLT